MARIGRQDILTRLRGMLSRGEPIIGGGAGTGLSAKCEEARRHRPHRDLQLGPLSHGARLAGRLLAYGNANEIVLEMARECAARGPAHAGTGRGQRHPTPFLL
jgi:predicted TIM-barrel enzyme